MDNFQVEEYFYVSTVSENILIQRRCFPGAIVIEFLGSMTQIKPNPAQQ